jgi:hypothetical protein
MCLRGIRVWRVRCFGHACECGCGRAVAVGMALGARTAATITVRLRRAPNVGVSAVSLVDADAEVLAAAWPWREFRWRTGQKPYSGSYWSATEGRHVIYESRLELARLYVRRFRSVGAPHLCTAVPVGDAIPRAHDENNSVKRLRKGGTAGKNEPIRARQPISWRTGA